MALAVKRFVILSAGLFLLFLLLNLLFPLPDKISYSVIVPDAEGNVVNAYLTKVEKWSMKTGMSEISILLRKIRVAKEDNYFY